MSPVAVTIKGHSTAHTVPVPAPPAVVTRDAACSIKSTDTTLLRQREAARVKAKLRASSSLAPPRRALPMYKGKVRINCMHRANRQGGDLPATARQSTCKCTAPQLIQMQDYNICMRDQCLGAWVYQQAVRTTFGSYYIHALMKMGSDIWLDFLQHFRVACWIRLVEKDRPMLHLTIADATRAYHKKLSVHTTVSRDVYQQDPEEAQEMDAKQQKSLEELLNENAEALTIHDSPYQYTLLREVAGLFPPDISGDALMLHMAEQLEIQEVALLLDRPIAATVEWAHREQQLLRSRACP